MKFLLALILLTNFSLAADRKQKRLALKEQAGINQIDNQADAFCGNFNTRLQAACSASILKALEGRIDSSMSGLIQDAVQFKSSEDLKAELQAEREAAAEAKCIANYILLLEEASQVPVTSDCSGLQLEWSDYQESLQGSGSGGQ